MNFEKLLEQEAQRAALQDYEEVTEKTKNYSYKFSKEFIQKMNKMIYEEKRKAKKKRRRMVLFTIFREKLRLPYSLQTNVILTENYLLHNLGQRNV